MIRLPKVEINECCIKCNTNVSFMVYADDWDDWQDNQSFIQDAFWYISPDQREILLSKVCGKCWDELFGDLDNDEE